MSPSYSDPSGLSLPTINIPQQYGLEEDSDEISLKDLTGLLRRRWWIIVLVGLMVGGFVLNRQLSKPPIFESEFQLLVSPPESNNMNPLSQLQGSGLLNLPRSQDYIATQTEILQSNTLLEPVWKKIYGDQPEEDKISYNSFLSNLSVSLIKDTGIVEIKYRDKDPETVKGVLESLAESYLDYTKGQREKQESDKLKFINQQLPKFERKVSELQGQLLRLQKQYGFFDPTLTGGEITKRLDETTNQRQVVLTKIQQLNAQKKALEQRTGVDNKDAFNLASLAQSPAYGDLVKRLSEINLKLAEATTLYTNDNPQVQQLQEEKEKVMELLKAEVNKNQVKVSDTDLNRTLASSNGANSIKATALEELSKVGVDLDVLNIELQDLTTLEAQLKAQLQQFTNVAGQYLNLQQALELETNSMVQLITAKQALEIETANSYIPWQLVSTIVLPEKPINTFLRDILLSLTAGLIAGGAAGLLVDKLDPAYHTVEDLQSDTSSTLLGYIPLEKKLPVSIKELKPLQSEILFEAYAKLYSNLFFLKRKQECHSFVISSAESGDGKSTTSFFMAQAAARLGQRVLLVDGDRYFPQKENWTILAKITSSTVTGNDHVKTEVNTLEGELNQSNGQLPEMLSKNLFYFKVQDDTMNPEQLVSASHNFVVQLEKWKQTFDLVLIDTPPVLGLTDSRLIADQTDGIVLVVRLSKTRKENIKEAFRELALADLNVLGIVANGVTSTSGGYGYYGRYYNRYYTQKAMQRENQGIF